MTSVRGKIGSYPAGNLFLFPWLKPKGAHARRRQGLEFRRADQRDRLPAGEPDQSGASGRRALLQLRAASQPSASFIGFIVDAPYSKLEEKLGLYSNISKLADGKPVGIDWASSNLNHPWFGGNRQIPASETCNGKAWRAAHRERAEPRLVTILLKERALMKPLFVIAALVLSTRDRCCRASRRAQSAVRLHGAIGRLPFSYLLCWRPRPHHRAAGRNEGVRSGRDASARDSYCMRVNKHPAYKCRAQGHQRKLQ